MLVGDKRADPHRGESGQVWRLFGLCLNLSYHLGSFCSALNEGVTSNLSYHFGSFFSALNEGGVSSLVNEDIVCWGVEVAAVE